MQVVPSRSRPTSSRSLFTARVNSEDESPRTGSSTISVSSRRVSSPFNYRIISKDSGFRESVGRGTPECYSDLFLFFSWWSNRLENSSAGDTASYRVGPWSFRSISHGFVPVRGRDINYLCVRCIKALNIFIVTRKREGAHCCADTDLAGVFRVVFFSWCRLMFIYGLRHGWRSTRWCTWSN